MTHSKPTPERKHRSGANVQEWQRKTILVGVRCPRELAVRARRLVTRHTTLADLLRIGVEAAEKESVDK